MRDDDLDEETVSTLKMLVSPDQPDFLRDLVEVYLRDANERLGELRAAIDGEDEAQLREVAHSLKGASQSIGAAAVGSAAEALEMKARAGSVIWAQASADYDTLTAALRRTRPRLEALAAE